MTSTQHAIKYVLLSQIKPDPKNPRAHKAGQLKAIAKSISTFGFNVPLLLDANDQLIAGHGRYAAAKIAGLSEAPVIYLHHLNEHQRRAFMVADNRLHDQSSWDRDKLALVMFELSEADLDFDLDAAGFSVTEIDLLISSADAELALDDETPEPGPPVTAVGDLWTLGRHRLLCADALNSESYARLMENEQAHVVITDPPFNVPIDGHVSGLGKIKHRTFVQGTGEMSEDGFIDFLRRSMTHSAAFSKDGALHYWAMDWRHLYELSVAARSVFDEHVNLCVWTKHTPGMGSFYRSQHELFDVWRKGKKRHRNNVQLGRFGRSRSNVWSHAGANSFSRASDEGNLLALHPTVKPVALLADILLDCTKRGEIVLDPFSGSGSTFIAAEKVGRSARGLELDPLYVDTIIRRWQRWSGEQVSRSDGELFDDLESRAEGSES